MTTVIRGTDDSASTPALTGTDADTGIFFPAANTMAMSTGGSERMRIDSAGNVGIGTSSPGAKLDVRGSSTFLVNATNPTAWISVDSALTTGSMYNQWNTTSSVGISGTYTNHPYVFVTNNNERARIDSGGNLLVGTTTALGQITSLHTSAKFGYADHNTDSSGVSQISFRFMRNSADVGSITTTSSATAYNTSSDYRLKENIAPMTGALAVVQQLNPVTYTWKADGSAGEGFIAHELQEVAPYAVSGEKDGEQMQGVDYGKLTPILTAALQEAIAKIETLESRIAVLEAK